jgi:hypothetical protein
MPDASESKTDFAPDFVAAILGTDQASEHDPLELLRENLDVSVVADIFVDCGQDPDGQPVFVVEGDTEV